jgi:hypothetical protein
MEGPAGSCREASTPMSSMRSKSTKEKLKAAKLPEDSVEITLRGDLVAVIKEAEAELTSLRQHDATAPEVGRRLGAAPPSSDPREVELAQLIHDAQLEEEDGRLTVRMRAHTRVDWKKRIREHPPRADNTTDRPWGCNTDTFFPVVIREAIVDPELDDEDWDNLQTATAGGEWDKLIDCVYRLNREAVDVPKSPLASMVLEKAKTDFVPPVPSE